jgi:hypothetical protein
VEIVAVAGACDRIPGVIAPRQSLGVDGLFVDSIGLSEFRGLRDELSVTLTSPTFQKYASSKLALRLVIVVFAVLLAVQSVWLLLAELSRPNVDGSATGLIPYTTTAQQRDAAAWAAAIGAIRGDLWTEYALAFSDLLVGEGEVSTGPGLATTVARASLSLDHAINYAPHQSNAWLLLTGLALRFPQPELNAAEILKMSYYTGPSEQHLIPLRLQLAVKVNRFDDIEMQQFVRRDLGVLLARKQIAAITDVYNSASSDGRKFLEQAVSDFDPTASEKLRSNAAQRRPPLPN